jgi:hypothetical protein
MTISHKYMDWINKEVDLFAGLLVEHFLVFDMALKLTILLVVLSTALIRLTKEVKK